MVVSEILSLKNIEKYNCDVLIVPTIFSTISSFTCELDQLSIFNNRKIGLKLDRIIEEDELIELEIFIKKSLSYNIEFYIFTDMSVYYILKKYNIEHKAVYFSKTINCSVLDIKEYNKLGIKCLVSTELTLEDMISISNIENNFIYCYGYFNIFYSKRKLLSLYNEYAHLQIECTNKMYSLLEETRKEYYPIIENKNGTFIFSHYCMLIFKEINLLNKNNYFYIDSTKMDEQSLIKVINIYNKLFNDGYSDDLLNELMKIDNNIGTSFLYLQPEILKENK